MDEETNQLDCTAIAAAIAAVTSYNNPECLLLPEDFATSVLEIIQIGVRRDNSIISSCQDSVFICQHSNSSHQHYRCSCSDVATCSECMTLIALSAIEAVFEFLDETNTNTNNSSGCAAKVDNQSKDNVEATFVDCSLVKQCHSRTASESWYLDAARILSSRSSIDLLVKCLISSNKFKSFLARKVLISGMNADLIEVCQVLAMLKQECLAVVQFCVPLLEILRDMMSRKKCKNKKINSTTFSFCKEVEFLDFMRARFNYTKKSFLDTSGFLEYLSLLCKVVKYVVGSCERFDAEDMAFIVFVVEKICLPFGDYFFTISRADKGHLICLEYVKVINLILDKRFLENSSAHHEKIYQISKCLRPKILAYLKMAEDSGLLCNVSFIGDNLNLKTKNSMNSTSSLKRLIILLVLKTSAVTLKGEGDYTAHIEHNLETFWNEMSSSVSISKSHESKDWLPVVFSDQDDQWITALICLLVIHKNLDKCRPGDEQELRPKSGKTINSPTLQQTICPHRLFLQLVRFIDYDHLVLTDFLTSPETPFLFYFTQYLHVIIEDWQGFLSSCVNDVQVNHSNVGEMEHSISGRCSETDVASLESTKHIVSFPELSTSTALQLRNLIENSDREAQVFLERNSPLPCHLSREVLTASASSPPCLNSVSISPVHSSEPQHSLLPSSLTQDNYKSQLPVKSCLAFQSSESERSESVACNTPGSMLCTLSPTITPSNTSSMFIDAKTEHSFNQSFSNQENSDSQHPKCDDGIFGMGNIVTSRSYTSLVAYSDSDSEISLDSETSMTGSGANCVSGKESVEEHLSNTCIRNSSKIASSVEANNSCVSELDSESEDSSFPELGGATGGVGDHYVEGSGELDAVMGMMIRLRLHVERLDHNKLFPYNVKSLLRLLESCEELYEMPV